MKSFVCGGIWTGPGNDVLPPSRISISDGRISEISSSGDSDSPLFMIPSFADAHCHLLWSGMQRMFIDLEKTGSASDILELVSSEIHSEKTGRILRAYGFDESTWADPVLPALNQLDSATGNRPVILRRVCGHEALVNSAMLELLPPECQGVNYSTGVIKEGIVFDFETIFPLEASILDKAVSLASEMAFASGVTSICTFEPLITAKALLQNRPSVRTSIFLYGNDAGFLSETSSELEGILHRIDGLKFFLDGSLGASTAAVSGKYEDGESAEPILSDEQVRQSLELAFGLGLTPAYHAIGSKALTQIDRVSYAYIKKENSSGTARIRIEHAEELIENWPGHWDPSVHSFIMQPNFVNRWQMPGGLYECKMGKDKYIRMNPFNLVLDAGFPMGFSSDSMPFGPLKGLDGATNHPIEEYRLDTAAALFAYTLGAASICGFSDLAEEISPGRTADLTILSADPFRTPWSEIEIAATICGGEVVYEQAALMGEN